MSEDEVVPLCPILSEVLVELRRRAGLDVACVCAERVTDAHQSIVGATVPGLIRDRAGCEEGDTEVRAGV